MERERQEIKTLSAVPSSGHVNIKNWDLVLHRAVWFSFFPAILPSLLFLQLHCWDLLCNLSNFYSFSTQFPLCHSEGWMGQITTDMKASLSPVPSLLLGRIPVISSSTCFHQPSCVRIMPLPIRGHLGTENTSWEIKKEIEREQTGRGMIATGTTGKNRRWHGEEVIMSDGLLVLLRCR